MQIAPATLLQLFSDHADAAELVLGQLVPKRLAGLSATCCSLHTSVTGAKAAWQRAARRELPPHHPGLQAPCVRAYLLRQHTAAANIRLARCTAWEVACPEGALAPDLTMHATLQQVQALACACYRVTAHLISSCTHGAQLAIRAMPGCQTLRVIDLPEGPAPCRPQDLLWAPDSCSLVIRAGGAWALLPGQRSSLFGSLNEVASEEAGLVFVSLQTGGCWVVALPLQGDLLRDGRPPWCYEWSSKGYLPVLQLDGQGQRSLCLYNSSGSLIGQITAVDLQGCTQLQPNLISWSPDGLIACFHVEWTEESRSDRTWLWLWRPFQSASQLQGIKIEWPFSERLLCWSPCSSMVLLQADPGRSFICHVDGHVGWQDGPERVLEWTMTGVLSHGIGRSVSSSSVMRSKGCISMRWHRVSCSEPGYCQAWGVLPVSAGRFMPLPAAQMRRTSCPWQDHALTSTVQQQGAWSSCQSCLQSVQVSCPATPRAGRLTDQGLCARTQAVGV